MPSAYLSIMALNVAVWPASSVMLTSNARSCKAVVRIANVTLVRRALMVNVLRRVAVAPMRFVTLSIIAVSANVHQVMAVDQKLLAIHQLIHVSQIRVASTRYVSWIMAILFVIARKDSLVIPSRIAFPKAMSVDRILAAPILVVAW